VNVKPCDLHVSAALLAVSGYFLPVVPSRNIRTPVYLSGRPGVYGGVLPPVDRSSNNNGWGNWGDEGESEGEGNDLGKDLLRGGFFLDLWNSYEDVLEERPILTKAVTSFIGFSVGDIIAQTLVGTDPFDPKRLARMASFGFLIHGTVSHFFYGFLDGQFPGTTAAIVFLKVFIDQV
jgi:protein Mpv17